MHGECVPTLLLACNTVTGVWPALHVATEVVADKDISWFWRVRMDCRGRVSQSQLLRQGQYLHLQLSSAIFGPANILINHQEQIQLNNGNIEYHGIIEIM